PVLRVNRDVDQAALKVRIAGGLLHVEAEHQAGQDERDQDRHGGAIGVPVPDVTAQGWRDHISPVAVLCGIAGWVDKSLIDSKLFYPLSIKTSGDRLRFYATQFALVEVDSSYYGIPKPENAALWAAQTPADFTFDVKSFSLFTNHPTHPMSLPPDIREQLPAA